MESHSRATLRTHASITLLNMRPMTKGDVAFVLGELRRKWHDADVVPEPICEGGLAIWAGDPNGATSLYKTVRFTGASGWPPVYRDVDTAETWRDAPDVDTVVVRWRNRRAEALHKPTTWDQMQEVSLCCKCNTNAPAWTNEELNTVVDALHASGAFSKGRYATSKPRW